MRAALMFSSGNSSINSLGGGGGGGGKCWDTTLYNSHDNTKYFPNYAEIQIYFKHIQGTLFLPCFTLERPMGHICPMFFSCICYINITKKN